MNAGMKNIDELSGAFEVDGAHSSVAFSVRHLVTDTKGSINIDSGYVNLQNANGPKIYILMNMESINTQNAMRDSHLKEKEAYFDVAKFKTAVFEASEIVKDEAGSEYQYIAKGKLTMKGVTKDLDLYFNYLGSQVEDAGEDGKFNVAGFEARTAISRGDYSIGSSLTIGENVKISITMEAAQPVK